MPVQFYNESTGYITTELEIPENLLKQAKRIESFLNKNPNAQHIKIPINLQCNKSPEIFIEVLEINNLVKKEERLEKFKQLHQKLSKNIEYFNILNDITALYNFLKLENLLEFLQNLPAFQLTNFKDLPILRNNIKNVLNTNYQKTLTNFSIFELNQIKSFKPSKFGKYFAVRTKSNILEIYKIENNELKLISKKTIPLHGVYSIQFLNKNKYVALSSIPHPGKYLIQVYKTSDLDKPLDSKVVDLIKFYKVKPKVEFNLKTLNIDLSTKKAACKSCKTPKNIKQKFNTNDITVSKKGNYVIVRYPNTAFLFKSENLEEPIFRFDYTQNEDDKFGPNDQYLAIKQDQIGILNLYSILLNQSFFINSKAQKFEFNKNGSLFFSLDQTNNLKIIKL